ncbi:hypothetical protein [Moraxella equi]|uniref:hypothetical protein n=1 Tax=Moraxella equi TaxID=60442 RepID=UPI00117EBA8D|nr:hypothetical protein [Moraxella equi]
MAGIRQHGLNGDEIHLSDDETRHLRNPIGQPPTPNPKVRALLFEIVMFEPLDKHHDRTAFNTLTAICSQYRKKSMARVHILADGGVMMSVFSFGAI